MPVRSQDILLEQDVNADTVVPSFGPNRKVFRHFFGGLGFVVGPDNPGGEVRYGYSKEFYGGLRYKFRISNFYALGFDIGWRNSNYTLKKTPGKILPNNIQHDKERLFYNTAFLTFYNRINFGRRGDHIGRFLDIGARVNWAFNVIHFTKDKLDTAGINNGGIIKTRTTQLLYTKPFFFDAVVRVGINRYVFFVSYRLSELFKPVDPELTLLYPDLPLIMAGMEVGFHK
ncbi:MAG: hypothetical protein HYY40_06965 [Bacteroidetes bacterium]|nr:hypothetical protein [Bacteroidota bacterium]